MPEWLIKYLIPYVVPVLVQGLTPIIAEYAKKLAAWLNAHLPQPVMVAVASVVAEGVNQASDWLAGASLPFGIAPLVAIFLNELGNYFGKQPPTPGVK
jgi:hypothetical protein